MLLKGKGLALSPARPFFVSVCYDFTACSVNDMKSVETEIF